MSNQTAPTVFRGSPMPEFAGHIGEAFAVVTEQTIGLVAKRDEQIEIAVVVVVDPRHLAG